LPVGPVGPDRPSASLYSLPRRSIRQPGESSPPGALKIRVARSRAIPWDRFPAVFLLLLLFVGVHHPVGLPHILIEGGVAAPAFRVADADRQGNGEGSAFVVRGQAFVDFVDVGVKLPLVDVLIDDAEFSSPPILAGRPLPSTQVSLSTPAISMRA